MQGINVLKLGLNGQSIVQKCKLSEMTEAPSVVQIKNNA